MKTIYVNAYVEETGNGTKEAPFKTSQEAIDALLLNCDDNGNITPADEVDALNFTVKCE